MAGEESGDRHGGAEGFNIALMPGSRASEVEALLLVLLESASRINLILGKPGALRRAVERAA